MSLLWAAVGLGLALCLLLVSLGTSLLNAVWLSGLLVILPAFSMAQVPLVPDEPLEREPVYLGSSLMLGILGLASLQLGLGAVGAGAMGLEAVPPGRILAWALGILGVAAVLLGGFYVAGRSLGIPETPLLVRLLPRTGRERALFGLLSLAAGFGEELAYRGYALALLTPLLSSAWAAAGVTSVVFGCLHAYQGPLGVVRTGLLGFALAASVVLSGTLWPAIVAHALVDILAGLVFGERLVRR